MTEELDEGEWRQLRVGTHFVQITKKDGELNINIRDHGHIAVAGEHKNNPQLLVEEGEFPTDIRVLPEGSLWERYNDEPR